MKVLITSRIASVEHPAAAVLEDLGATLATVDGTDREALIAAVADADALVVLAETIDETVIRAMPSCAVIARLGVGVDSVDVAAATAHGIWVTNVPDANYREVAVHAIALALAVTRRLPLLDRGIRRDGWASSVAAGVRRPGTQTFGLLGLGRIGREVASMARAIGYRVIATDPLLTAEAAADAGVGLVPQETLLAESDILSLHVPLTAETRNVIDAAALGRMRDTAVLVNVSRGGLVDEAALAAALREGGLFGAGLDVFATEPLEPASPLRELDSVILTPHAAHWSEESWSETWEKAFAEVARVLRGERPRNPVNAPA